MFSNKKSYVFAAMLLSTLCSTQVAIADIFLYYETAVLGGIINRPVSIDIVTDADMFAYQKYDGNWQDGFTPIETLPDGKKHYRVEQKNGKYGVAMYCGANKHAFLFQLTTYESRYVKFECNTDNTKEYKISGTLTDSTASPDALAVAMDVQYEIVSNNGDAYSLTVPQGKRDLLASSLKLVNNKVVPTKFYIQRDIMVDSDISKKDIVFTTSNSTVPQGYNFSSASGTEAESFLISKNGTHFRSSIDGKWYIPPQNKLIDGDFFTYYAEHSSNKTQMLEMYNAKNIARSDKNIDISYISPFNGVTYDNTDTFAGLNYKASAASQKFSMYLLFMQKQDSFDNMYFEVFLSSGWLNGSTSYTIPNLTALTTFQSAWIGNGADSVNAAAMMSSVSLEEIMRSDSMFRHKLEIFMVPGAKYEIANKKIF